MLAPISITLVFNGITLTFSLAILILLLWHDSRRLTNLYFSWFLLTMVVWSSGSLLCRGGAIAGIQSQYIENGLRLLELGFTSSALALYLYVVVLVGNRTGMFQAFALVAIVVLLAFHLLLYLLRANIEYEISRNGILNYNFTETSVLVFTFINLGILLIVWRSFRKIRRAALAFGIMLFCMGQLVALTSPRLRMLAVAEDAGSVAALIMAVSLVQAQIIQPLMGQSRQIDVVRDVGLVITSRVRLQNVLRTIAAQAAALLGADASIIFLRRENADEFILAAQYNIHENLLGERLRLHDGLAGKVAQERRSYVLNDYRREWRGIPDTPFAMRGFGAVIAVPLIFADDVVGVLLVIDGPENRLFELEDVRLLELLAPQAAVAIINSRLFEQERELTNELAIAKTQLETVLSSTDNPVIALDKKLRIIFANKAASGLVNSNARAMQSKYLLDLVPREFLPSRPRNLLKDLKRHKSHVYELEIAEKTYLCHLTRMEQPEEGWVAVLNDVSSLKELDRLQRHMMEFTTHQLKNPLQGAMLHLDELEDLGEDVLTDEMTYDIEVIREQMDRMNRLIKGILNLERLLNTDSLRFEQVDFYQLVRGVVNDMAPLAQNKSLSLQMSPLSPISPIIGDPQHLKEAVTCLVDNAIKYTPAAGKIEIHMQQELNHVLLKVTDTGIGIPLASQSHVFDRFYRVEQPGTEQIGGSGLGLSLVKTIIESHNGRVWLESENNHGSTFFITLPTM